MSPIREPRPDTMRKRPVNLSLNERNEALRVRAREAERIASMWNTFNEQNGSFADEHSTL